MTMRVTDEQARRWCVPDHREREGYFNQETLTEGVHGGCECSQVVVVAADDYDAALAENEQLRSALRAVCDNAEAIAVRMNKMAIDQGCDCQDSCICGFPDTLRELAAFECAIAAARKLL